MIGVHLDNWKVTRHRGSVQYTIAVGGGHVGVQGYITRNVPVGVGVVNEIGDTSIGAIVNSNIFLLG